jgi:hypothetical protein
MRSRLRRSPMYAVIAAALALGGAVGLPSAAAVAADPAPIGPHQYFVGEVNGASANAVIRVICPGPATPGQTGHPVTGQSVDVTPAASSSSASVGYTGEAADRVVVGFGGATTGSPVVLNAYEVRAEIPGTLNLPCSGTGRVTFTPAPASSTSRPATVTVTYQNIAV